MTSSVSELRFLLEGLVSRTPGAIHALLLSSDGLKMDNTSGLTVDSADQLAAIAAGMQSLSIGASAEFGDGSGGGVLQSMTQFPGGILFIVAAGMGAHLAVIAQENADAGLIGHNMQELVEQMSHHLMAAPRFGGASVS
ncbi:roadblock/LC7 domain-containing protein [Nocardia sp. NPDC052112]|uniref:roadblock/LC7 domain-containing protein n=1 Tax=Nocardia sp. NPDC052112 TaxID=3155646 RepID=UPI003432C703